MEWTKYMKEAIDKNDVDILPLRVRNENTFRGHLFLVFLASLARLALDDKLKYLKYNSSQALVIARDLKCKVFGSTILVKELVQKMKEIAEILGFTIPGKSVEGKISGN
jgi:transposase